MDSRVNTERLFDLGLGDILSIRVAGNIASEEEIGSMEYGCNVAGAKLILVLGHTHCDAVLSTISLMASEEDKNPTQKLENFSAISGPLSESVLAEREAHPDFSPENEAHVSRVIELNVCRTLKQITQRSRSIRSLVEERKILLLGGLYDVATGRVTFLNLELS